MTKNQRKFIILNEIYSTFEGDIMKSIISAKAVRAAMLREKIGVKDLARRVRGLSEPTISRISRQDTAARIPTIALLAEGLNVNPDDILVDSDNQKARHQSR